MRTVKQYWIKKRNKKTFNEQWDTLLNRIILPVTQRVEFRTIVDDLVDVQPLGAPITNLTYLDFQHNPTEKNEFPFWKIKVIFKYNE